MSDLDFGLDFDSAPNRLVGEREQRLRNADRCLRFGVSYLDRALFGISPHDLILIGARSGKGKTALATLIAANNARAGRRVHYFALEAEPSEIERRIKFHALSDIVQAETGRCLPCGYGGWYVGWHRRFFAEWEPQADERIADELRTLSTYYKGSRFFVDDFSRVANAIAADSDLIIVDHVHYIDTADQNENRGLKEAVAKIRDFALVTGTPVILVAHLRKEDLRNRGLVPTLDDFHGSSDLPKIATKAILFAPARDMPRQDDRLWPTYFCAAKNRIEGSVENFVGLVDYDMFRNRYSDDFLVGSRWAESFEEAATIPYWAKGET